MGLHCDWQLPEPVGARSSAPCCPENVPLQTLVLFHLVSPSIPFSTPSPLPTTVLYPPPLSFSFSSL